ncbi:MAG TPA: condensation domain-containing protein, partial [Longimicrobiaceae bacterium]
SALVFLDEIPRTPNGKTDRGRLPAPDASAAAAAYVAPRGPTEEALAGIWAEVLGTERVGAEDNFFELGGHSLLAMRLVSRVRAVLGVEIPVRLVFDAQTVAELAERIGGGAAAGPGLPPLVPVDRSGPLPLSFAQERLWFLHRLAPESVAYNVPATLRLRGPLDAAALGRALGALVERHESLRTVFPVAGGEPVQEVLPSDGFSLPVDDLAALPAGEREAEAARRARAVGEGPFDLERGPLFRAALLRLDAEDHVLALAMHHVVSDGWSMGVLFRDLDALYGAFSRGEPSPLAPLPVQYADFAVWQREWLRGETLEAQLGFWREQLRGAPPLLELPTDHPRPQAAGGRRGTHPLAIPGALVGELRALSRAAGATLFMTALAGFQALLARWSGEDDVLVGTPVAGRRWAEVEGLIGFFVNTLVLRADLAGDPDARGFLAQARERMLEAQTHQDVPFERLVEELGVERSLGHTPLFQVMFSFVSAAGRTGEEARLGGLAMEQLPADGGETPFDLGMVLLEEGEGLAGVVEYRAGLFEASTVARMAEHFRVLLEGIAAHPERRLSEISLLAPAERAAVLEEWSRGAAGHRRPACLHDLFAEQAARTPDAPAVVHGEASLTYAELDARAGALAGELRARGVGPEVPVGVSLERGVDLVAALLGVLRAGGVYVPLDPAYPAERLAFMLADSGARTVLTLERLAERLPDFGGTVMLLDTPLPHEGGGEHDVSPDNLAYVVYTSGSTGRPKGVAVTHAAASNLLSQAVKTFGAHPGSRVLQTASLSFDASLLEVFLALFSGAALHVADRETVLSGTALV